MGESDEAEQSRLVMIGLTIVAVLAVAMLVVGVLWGAGIDN